MGSKGQCPCCPFHPNGEGWMAMKKERKKYGRVRADSGQHRRIMAVTAILGLAAFVPTALRLHRLMVTDYEYYANLALRNQTRTTRVAAQRGLIYDCNMNVLACNTGVETVYLDPHELKQSKANVPQIAQVLGRNENTIKTQLSRARDALRLILEV